MRIAASALAGVVAVALAGCGSTKTVTVVAKATTTRVTGTTPSGSSTSAVVPSPPLATRAGSVNQEPATLSIVSLKRSGATVELTFELALSHKASEHAQIGGDFDDGIFEKINTPGASDIEGENSLDGIFLVDTTNAKKYPVARDSNNACLCDSALAGAFLEYGAPMFLSATFGAPPSTVHSVDVFIPHYGTFANVPLS